MFKFTEILSKHRTLLLNAEKYIVVQEHNISYIYIIFLSILKLILDENQK